MSQQVVASHRTGEGTLVMMHPHHNNHHIIIIVIIINLTGFREAQHVQQPAPEVTPHDVQAGAVAEVHTTQYRHMEVSTSSLELTVGDDARGVVVGVGVLLGSDIG